jgi:hypothetical protein
VLLSRVAPSVAPSDAWLAVGTPMVPVIPAARFIFQNADLLLRKIEAIEIHHLVPGGNEVPDELGLRV